MPNSRFDLTYETRSPGIPWWDRIDPLHEIKWIDTVRSNWESISAQRYILDVSPDGFLEHYIETVPSPIVRSPRMLHNHRAVRIMAMLNQWQQMTTLQISTILGEGRVAAWNTLSDLYDAGLVSRLIPKWWENKMTAEESGSGSVWRINRKEWVTKKWFDDLNNQEWALITNNQDPLKSSIGEMTPTALRHNLMTVEIMIKALESSPAIIGAWGEAHLSSENLHDISQYETDEVRKNIGDLALITGSGKIIVIETSGSGSMNAGTTNANKIVEKAAAWTAICGKSDLDIYTVFVESSTSPNLDKFLYNVRVGVENVSHKYVSRKSVREEGQSRVFAVDGRDWFPIARAVSSNFTNMNVIDTRNGKTVTLLDDSDLTPDASSDVVVNALSAIHIPWWITNKPKRVEETN